MWPFLLFLLPIIANAEASSVDAAGSDIVTFNQLHTNTVQKTEIMTFHQIHSSNPIKAKAKVLESDGDLAENLDESSSSGNVAAVETSDIEVTAKHTAGMPWLASVWLIGGSVLVVTMVTVL
jgi:hypothetical protein